MKLTCMCVAVVFRFLWSSFPPSLQHRGAQARSHPRRPGGLQQHRAPAYARPDSLSIPLTIVLTHTSLSFCRVQNIAGTTALRTAGRRRKTLPPSSPTGLHLSLPPPVCCSPLALFSCVSCVVSRVCRRANVPDMQRATRRPASAPERTASSRARVRARGTRARARRRPRPRSGRTTTASPRVVAWPSAGDAPPRSSTCSPSTPPRRPPAPCDEAPGAPWPPSPKTRKSSLRLEGPQLSSSLGRAPRA